ncbi:MAG: cytochrome C [candidate division Zixibacteria bacterium]|nr:cytochrome C [candidate division Zixibacteria bacterium]
MKSILSILAIAVVIVFLSWNMLAGDQEEMVKHPEVDFSLSCKECHKEMTPEVYQDWKSSKHGLMNYGCYMCHGDGQEEFYPSPGSERCVGCHSPQEVDFAKVPVGNCYDCHKGHTLKFHQ